jgi:hypothetical protein
MRQVTLVDIYRLLKESVKYWDIAIQPRPDTFAVIDDEEKIFASNINNEQLGYTILAKDKPHFYSRQWEKSGYNPSGFQWIYPAIFVYEQNMIVDNIMNNASYRHWNISINVLIQDFTAIKSDNFISSKAYQTRSEIYNDAENMLLNIFKYFENCIMANTTLDSSTKIYNKDYLDYLKANVSGFDYTLLHGGQTFLAEVLKFNSQPKTFNRAFIESLNSCVVFTDMQFATNCNDDMSYSFYVDESLSYDKQSDPSLDNVILIDSNEDPITDDEQHPIII